MMLVGWSLNEELEGMNYRCQNLHYYLDLLSIPKLAKALISPEVVALFATGLTRREISSPFHYRSVAGG